MEPSLSGNEITDSIRRIAREGDGLEPDQGSVGIWEATTNLITNGGFETNTTGWAGDAGASLAREAFPKFGSWACKVVTAAATNSGIAYSAVLAELGSVTWTITAWVRASVGGEQVRLGCAEYDGGFGFLHDNSVSVVLGGPGTYRRITLTFTSQAGTRNDVPYIYSDVASVQTFWVDGFQAEQQPIATPYVETDGASATRAASRVQMPSSLLSTTQGWVGMRVRLHGSSASPANSTGKVFQWYDSGNERIWGYIASSAWAMRRFHSGTDDNGAAIQIQAYEDGYIATLVFAWTATQVKTSVNGAPFTAVGNTNIPTLTVPTFDIGTGQPEAAGLESDAEFFWFIGGSGTLTDANAALIASLNNDPVLSDFPGTPTFFWDPNDAASAFPGAHRVRSRGTSW